MWSYVKTTPSDPEPCKQAVYKIKDILFPILTLPDEEPMYNTPSPPPYPGPPIAVLPISGLHYFYKISSHIHSQQNTLLRYSKLFNQYVKR